MIGFVPVPFFTILEITAIIIVGGLALFLLFGAVYLISTTRLTKQ